MEGIYVQVIDMEEDLKITNYNRSLEIDTGIYCIYLQYIFMKAGEVRCLLFTTKAVSGRYMKSVVVTVFCIDIVCVCVYVCFLPIPSGRQVRWTYQPGSHKRKVRQDFSSTFLLRCVPQWKRRNTGLYYHLYTTTSVLHN